MSNPENAPDFLPGDPNPPAERYSVPDEPKSAPAKRLPLPVVILGGVLALALLVGGFIGVRIMLGDPSERGTQGPGNPMTTLQPREGTPAPLQRADVGERVQIEGLYGEGSFMVVRHEWTTEGTLPTTAGRQYLNVEVRYDATEGSLFIKPDYFSAYDSAKNEYLAGIGSAKDQLPAQELQEGRSVTGWVSIELPPGMSFFVVSDEGINPLVMVNIPAP